MNENGVVTPTFLSATNPVMEYGSAGLLGSRAHHASRITYHPPRTLPVPHLSITPPLHDPMPPSP